MYKNTEWLDRVIDADSGEIIQEGTDQSAAHFNNMEEGIGDAQMAFALLCAMYQQANDRFQVIEGEIEAMRSEHSIVFPKGFTKENCCVMSVMASKDSETFYLDNAKEYVSVCFGTFSSGKPCITVGNVDYNTAVKYKIALQRYK